MTIKDLIQEGEEDFAALATIHKLKNLEDFEMLITKDLFGLLIKLLNIALEVFHQLMLEIMIVNGDCILRLYGRNKNLLRFLLIFAVIDSSSY